MPVALLQTHEPLFELNSCVVNRSTSITYPYLITEIKNTMRPNPNNAKRYCCSYTFGHDVPQRELLFNAMRRFEPTCYAFGRSCRTPDNPFVAPSRDQRSKNGEAFSEFAFNVAMENCVKPGYITEKIGYAFESGSVPIYWGDNDTVNRFFNPASFFNVLDYSNMVVAADAAVQIWRDPQKLQKYLDAPIRINNELADYEAIYTEYRPWQKKAIDALRDAFPDLS